MNSALRTGRRLPVFEAVSGALGTAILAVLGYAIWRHLHAPAEPMLPMFWSRPDAPATLPPLLGKALLTRWQVDWIALVSLAVLVALYLGGIVGAHRNGSGWPASRTALFLAGIGVCALATNSSIAVYDMALFSAHMIGHLMLVMLAPALIAAGRPLTLLIAASRPPWRPRLERAALGPVVSLLTTPPVALACYAAIIVGTHLTGLMDTIMRSPWAGQAEHAAYLIIGGQFFTVVLGGEPIRWQLTTPARWLLLGISMAVDTFVGVILLMAPVPIARTAVPGLSVDALSDTHTGGAIMWVGGDGLMALVMILLVRTWITDPARRRSDRQGWTELARQSVFAEHTGGADGGAEADADFDDDETRLTEYNAWLARMARDRH